MSSIVAELQSSRQGAKTPGPSNTLATRTPKKAISMDGLPEELLADILGRLPPQSLAACRSVCGDWRAVIDARGMLHAVLHLVPRRMRGIYIHQVSQEQGYSHTCFFSRESPSPGIDAALRRMPRHGPHSGCVLDHRNGLLLYINGNNLHYVCNPATRRWIELPKRPFEGLRGSEHLMFDPVVSLHYDVLFFPEPPGEHGLGVTKQALERLFQECPSLGADWEHRRIKTYDLRSMAWPPVSYPVQVFSSRTGQWEEKRFTREDDTAVTVSDVWFDPWGQIGNKLTYRVWRYHSVYWREALYLQCLGGFIIRFSLQKEKYLVIKTPKLVRRPRSLYSDERKKVTVWRMYLGKSQQGIYYSALSKNQLRVWVLHESSDSHTVPVWELKHHAALKSSFSRHYALRCKEEKIDESWNLDRGDQKGCAEDRGDREWDSDNDSVVDMGGGGDGDEVGSIADYWVQCANARTDLLGFHPHKEIAFLGKRFDGFAYYLRSSKLQYLGSFRPNESRYKGAATYDSFIYTPCMSDMLPLQEEEEDNSDEDDGDDDDEDDDDEKENYYDEEDDAEEEEDDENIHWM